MADPVSYSREIKLKRLNGVSFMTSLSVTHDWSHSDTLHPWVS